MTKKFGIDEETLVEEEKRLAVGGEALRADTEASQGGRDEERDRASSTSKNST